MSEIKNKSISSISKTSEMSSSPNKSITSPIDTTSNLSFNTALDSSPNSLSLTKIPTPIHTPTPVLTSTSSIIPETITTDFIKMPYKYIDDDQLSKNFTFCEIPNDNILNVHFCLFSINTECFIEGDIKQSMDEYGEEPILRYNEVYPFLQFITEKKEDFYDFPSMEYECIIPNQTHEIKGGFDEENGEDIDIKTDEHKTQDVIHFENECFKKILSFLKDENVIHKKNIKLSDLYKGFFEYSTKEIFVFIDITELSSEFREDYIFAVIDEVLYKRDIYGFNVNPLICNMFCKNRQFTKIRNLENEEYPTPLQVFLCEYREDEYMNIHKDNIHPYKTMDHTMFSRGYYFSGDYIGEDAFLLKRFCCFIVNCLYIEDDIITELKDEDEKQSIREKSVSASTIYFKEDNIQLWAVKNILHFTEI